ncbi:hypothetical protein HY950_04230 [Candidatus Gottesmanbacteria bacterium]|nr:hypothetical protein [Candidatus Gottesmanbacteria bacterium]
MLQHLSYKTIILALAASILLILVISSLSPSSPLPIVPSSPPPISPSSSVAPQQSEGGNVTVTVTPVTLKVGFPASFDVAFETHSVDLDFDVEAIAGLTDINGTTYKPTWQGSPPGGHHRSGTLIFTPDIPQQVTLTLTLRDIAGVPERTFVWKP